MELLELHQYPGLLDHVLSFLGRGHEYCMAIASTEALTIIAQTADRGVSGWVANLLANVDTMDVCQLKSELRRLRMNAYGTKTQLILQLSAIGLPRRSVWYFMSTTALCNYARDSMGLLVGRNTTEKMNLMNKAARRGLIPGVQMLRRLDPPCPWHSYTTDEAVKGGQLEMLQWLRRLGKSEGQCPWTLQTCIHAADGGHFEVLKWMRQPKLEGQCPWDEETCETAAREGHLHVLQWLRLPGKSEGQCGWNARTCGLAAGEGHLEVLKWLRLPDKPEGQAPWNEYTCKFAAWKGHLNVLQWLRQPGKPEGQCPWDKWTCYWAVQGGHLEVLKWLRSGDDPCPWNKTYCRGICISAEMRQWVETQPDGE